MINRILFLLLFLLASCGYQPLYSKKEAKNFNTKELELIGNININKNIVSALSINLNINEYQINKIVLENNKKILETSKNKQGQPDSFKMIIDAKLILIDKKNNIIKKNVSEEFSYKNKDNKFDLSEYEKNLEQNLINNIIRKFRIFLSI